MKKLSIYLIALFLIPSILFTGCKDDPIEEIPDPAFTVLTDYLTTNSMDLDDIKGVKGVNYFVTAPPATNDDIAAFIAKYTILDIRSSEHFAEGHIDGAKNIVFGDILTEAETASLPVLMVCYTGQTACYATSLLRLAGYSDTQALKWGMCGWHSDLSAKWDAVVGTDLASAAGSNWTATSTASLTFSDPELTETIEDGAALLSARIDAVLADGFKTVTAVNVLATPGDYFINNYFSDTHYEGFGHINGAYRISPLTLAGGEYNNLDPDLDVVTYCYTGQTSAVITAYLRVIGYDAYSLVYGMNGLSHGNSYWDTPVLNHWGEDSNPKELNYIVD